MNTGDTVTVLRMSVYCAFSLSLFLLWTDGVSIPDGENAAGLGEVGLILDTADTGLEDGGNLGGGGLCVSSVATDAVGNGSGGASLLSGKEYQRAVLSWQVFVFGGSNSP